MTPPRTGCGSTGVVVAGVVVAGVVVAGVVSAAGSLQPLINNPLTIIIAIRMNKNYFIAGSHLLADLRLLFCARNHYLST
jgi:hypothetical protein